MSGEETGERERLADKGLGEQNEVAHPIAQQKLAMLVKLDLEFLSLVCWETRFALFPF